MQSFRSIKAAAAFGLIALGASMTLALWPLERQWADPADTELVALGAGIYAAYCSSCHGADLKGQPDWQARLPEGGFPAPPHDASGHTWHHSDALLFRYTKEGGKAIAGSSFKSNMPGFGAVLSDREIWAVLAFIKAQWPQSIRDRQARLSDVAG